MRVKITVDQLVSSGEVLRVLANTKLPVKTSYRLNKILRKVSREIEIFEDEKRKVFEEYGEETDPGTLKIPKEKMDEASKMLDQLLEEEVELDLPDITIDQLGNIDLTPLELQGLEPLLYDDDLPEDE